MSYIKELKKAYINNQIQLFAHELFISHKYNKNKDCSLEIHFFSFRNAWPGLSEKEEKRIFNSAIKLTNKKYKLNIKIN